MLQHEWPGEHAKWKKPDMEGQTLHDMIYMLNLKQSNPQEQRVGSWFSGAKGEWGDEEVLESIVQHSAYR